MYLFVFGGGMNIMNIIIITITNIITCVDVKCIFVFGGGMNIMKIITCVDAACIFVFGGGRVAEK